MVYGNAGVSGELGNAEYESCIFQTSSDGSNPTIIALTETSSLSFTIVVPYTPMRRDSNTIGQFYSCSLTPLSK